MMKKSRPILSFLMILALIFALNPCVLATDSSDTGTGKILVAYYSATGSTRRVASYIAETLHADTFEITPVNPYSSDDLNWTNSNSRVCQEHDNEALRDIELVDNTVDNWDSYDVIFIGYPIWWGIAAWPVDNFIKNNNFSGKTVIPFCTSASSGLGQSGQLLAEMAKTGDWQEGYRFRSSASESEVQSWVKGLELPPVQTTYTIHFDANGGTVSPSSAQTGTDGKLSNLLTPDRSDYVFGGWYTAEIGGNQVTEATVFDRDTTIYAHWLDIEIEAPKILEGACRVDTSTGAVTMTIPTDLSADDLPAIKNVLCAFDNVEYQAGSVSTDNQEIAFMPKDKNYQTVKVFTLDENYRPVCKPTVITIQVPTSD